MVIIMTLRIGNGAGLKSSSQWELKEVKKKIIIPSMNYLFSKLF